MNKLPIHKIELSISLISIALVTISFFLPILYRNYTWTAVILAHALLNLWNYKTQKNSKYLVIGIGLLITALIALLNTLFIINILWINIWLFVLALIIAAHLFEHLTKSKNN
jgi:hypothetical protein